MRSRERAGRSTANTKFRRLNRPPKGERWSWIPLELIDSPAWRCLTRQDHLVPRHRGFDRLGVTENGQVFGGEEHLDAARDAWLAANVAEALQR